jgi:hypothetical protein
VSSQEWKFSEQAQMQQEWQRKIGQLYYSKNPAEIELKCGKIGDS